MVRRGWNALGDAVFVRDTIDLVRLLNDLRVERRHDELARVPLVSRLRSNHRDHTPQTKLAHVKTSRS